MRTRMTTVERLEQIARAGITGGYGVIHTWDDQRDTRYGGHVRRMVTLYCDMGCENPYEYELHARYSATHGKAVKPLSVVVRSRCRRCGPCRERRQVFWQARAVAEWGKSHRTLFGTLTLDPKYDLEVDAHCRIEASERGVDFDRDLTLEEQFRARTVVAGRELTRFIKRVRQGDSRRGPIELRYLFVAEAHNGARTSDAKRHRPHWHCLLHEQTKDGGLVLPDEWATGPTGEVSSDKYGNPYLINDAFLKTQWRYGFSSFALCRTPQAASYLCKYLSKEETRARVRASFRYGLDQEAGEHANANEPVSAAVTLREKSTAP